MLIFTSELCFYCRRRESFLGWLVCLFSSISSFSNCSWQSIGKKRKKEKRKKKGEKKKNEKKGCTISSVWVIQYYCVYVLFIFIWYFFVCCMFERWSYSCVSSSYLSLYMVCILYGVYFYVVCILYGV